jgi:acetyl esterase/lipase
LGNPNEQLGLESAPALIRWEKGSMVSKSGLIFLFALACNVAAWQRIETDVNYGTDAAQKLDLRTPASTGFATLIFVHGGSLTSGDKADSDYGHVCDSFPAAGIACANVNYRLAPLHAWPAQAEDVASAVWWIRTHIATYGGVPSKLFLLGHSSGATLVALLGTDDRYLARRGMKLSDLRGVMPMGSIMWDDELEQAIAREGRAKIAQNFLRDPDNRIYGSFEGYQDHWPARHIHARLPPFLFLIAETEREQPPVLRTNVKFAEDARSFGNEAGYKVFAGRKHYTMIRQLHQPGDEVFSAVLGFIRGHSF